MGLSAWPMRWPLRRTGTTEAPPRWTQYFDALLTVLIAPVCAVCGEFLERPSHSPVCDRCWNAIRLFAPPVCDHCGLPLPLSASLPPAECAGCRGRTSLVARARAIGDYDGALRGIIHALKYQGRRRVAGPLGHLLRNRARDVLHDADFTVPVPLHRNRERQRGFNQSAAIACVLGLPVRAALRRTRSTPSQATLPATLRHANVRGAFTPSRHIAGMRDCVVVLVDDVCTTGATLDACARVLKAEGVREVRAVTAARVVPRQR